MSTLTVRNIFGKKKGTTSALLKKKLVVTRKTNTLFICCQISCPPPPPPPPPTHTHTSNNGNSRLKGPWCEPQYKSSVVHVVTVGDYLVLWYWQCYGNSQFPPGRPSWLPCGAGHSALSHQPQTPLEPPSACLAYRRLQVTCHTCSRSNIHALWQ